MKVKLLREARIRHYPGEIVEVSPAEAGFLLSTGTAVEVREAPKERETPEAMMTAETPEAMLTAEEKPEAKTPKKTTRVKK